MAKVYNAVLPVKHKPSKISSVHSFTAFAFVERKKKKMKKKNGKEMEYRRTGRHFKEMLQEAEGQGAKRRPKVRDDTNDFHGRNNGRAGQGRTYRDINMDINPIRHW
jgi:hypothetical protein